MRKRSPRTLSVAQQTMVDTRLELQLSVTQMAYLIQVDGRTVRRYEDGTREPWNSATRIAELARFGFIRGDVVMRLAAGRGMPKA